MADALVFMVLWPPAAFYFCVGAHELGHAFCGRLAGFQIREFRVGGAPVFLRFQMGLTLVTIGSIHKPSLVRPYAILPMRKGAWLLLYAGGWIGNLAGIAILFPFVSRDVLSSEVSTLCFGTILLQALTIAGTMWPYNLRVDDKSVASDGAAFLRALRYSAAQIAHFDHFYLATLRRYWDGRGEAPGPSATLNRVITLTNQAHNPAPGASAGLLEDFAREFALSPHPAERLWLLDGAVTMMLYAERPEDVARLDAWSAEALALRPDMPTLKGSRGAALVQLGRYEEGKAILLEAGYDDPFNAMLNHAFMARAEFRLGDAAAAGKQLEDAFACSATIPALREGPCWALLKRISSEIGVVPPPAATTGEAPQGLKSARVSPADQV